MNDSELLKNFEECSIDPKDWNHRAHLRVAYLYCCRFNAQAATELMRDGLVAYLDRWDIPTNRNSGYHETLTVAWMRVLDGMIVEPNEDSESFLARFPELLEKRFLMRFYSEELLSSPESRWDFIEPDRQDLPAARSPLV